MKKDSRRLFGAHLTSSKIFLNFIFPEIQNKLKYYIWVDLFAGEGNLILPILNTISSEEKIDFFYKSLYIILKVSINISKCLRMFTLIFRNNTKNILYIKLIYTQY